MKLFEMPKVENCPSHLLEKRVRMRLFARGSRKTWPGLMERIQRTWRRGMTQNLCSDCVTTWRIYQSKNWRLCRASKRMEWKNEKGWTRLRFFTGLKKFRFVSSNPMSLTPWIFIFDGLWKRGVEIGLRIVAQLIYWLDYELSLNLIANLVKNEKTLMTKIERKIDSNKWWFGWEWRSNLPDRLSKESSRPWSCPPGKRAWPEPAVAADGIPLAKGWWEGVAEYHAGGQPVACPLNILSLS